MFWEAVRADGRRGYGLEFLAKGGVRLSGFVFGTKASR